MRNDSDVNNFLSKYSDEVIQNAHFLRKLIFENLPDIQEQLDIPAKMIGYCYGQKYAELVCTLIPSKKGLKLGFYKGIYLLDSEKILQGHGKFSRYVEIKTQNNIKLEPLIALLKEALKAYKTRLDIK